MSSGQKLRDIVIMALCIMSFISVGFVVAEGDAVDNPNFVIYVSQLTAASIALAVIIRNGYLRAVKSCLLAFFALALAVITVWRFLG